MSSSSSSQVPPPYVLGEYLCNGEGNKNYGCGAILEIAENNLYQTIKEYRDGSVACFLTFKCPECDSETNIPGKDYFVNASNVKRSYVMPSTKKIIK